MGIIIVGSSRQTVVAANSPVRRHYNAVNKVSNTKEHYVSCDEGYTLFTASLKSHIFYISHDLFAEAVLLHFVESPFLPQPRVETFSLHFCIFLCASCANAHESA